MTDDIFPPRATRTSEVDAALEVMRSMDTDTNETTYLSAPITGGPRLLDLAQDWPHGEPKEGPAWEKAKYGLIPLNVEDARPLVKELRERPDFAVIAPTEVGKIDKWAQNDYIDFWAQVIEKFASEVVLRDGWNYSNGCAYEFFTARRLNRSTFDQSMTPITGDQGMELINEAISALDDLDMQTGNLSWVASTLAA